MHRSRHKAGREFGGIKKGLSIGCLAAAIALTLAVILFMRWLTAPGYVPPAEHFITRDCVGFLIIHLDPEDKGLKAMMGRNEKEYKEKAKEDPGARSPWLLRKVFGDSSAQNLQRFGPAQLVWVLSRKPHGAKVQREHLFSLSRGRGWFSLMRKGLTRDAEGIEKAGEHKGTPLFMIKDEPEAKKTGEQKGEGKPQQPESDAEELEGEPDPFGFGGEEGIGPWVAVFDTTMVHATTLEGLKRSVDLATDPEASFRGQGHIAVAYKGFSDDMEVICAVNGDAETSAKAVAGLFALLSPETAEQVRQRLKLQDVTTLSGFANVVEADRAHVAFTVTCASPEAAKGIHSRLAAEADGLQAKKEIGGLKHTQNGSSVTVEFSITDLDDLPRGEREARKKAEEELKKKARKPPHAGKQANPDADH